VHSGVSGARKNVANKWPNSALADNRSVAKGYKRERAGKQKSRISTSGSEVQNEFEKHLYCTFFRGKPRLFFGGGSVSTAPRSSPHEKATATGGPQFLMVPLALLKHPKVSFGVALSLFRG
jgi:hypothetical protein